MAGGPANAVARLAIDSADVTTTALVVAYVGIAGVAYVGVGPSSRRTGSRTERRSLINGAVGVRR